MSPTDTSPIGRLWTRVGARLTTYGRTLPTAWSMPALLVLAVAYLTAVTLVHTQATSPIDEWVYIDYLTKIPTQGMVFTGELVGNQTLSLMSCHGTSPFGPIGTPCGLTPNPLDYPNQGQTTASAYTPLYFYVTFAVGWLASHLAPLSEVVGWRLSSVIWAVATTVVLVRLLRAWGSREFVVFALGALMLASPFSYWTYTYVSTDAPVMFFGALLALLVTRLVRGEGPAWPVLVVSLVAVAFKSTALVGVAAAVVYLITEIVARRCRARRAGTDVGTRWSWLGIGLGSLLGSMLLLWGWTKITAALAVTTHLTGQGIDTPFTPTAVLSQVMNVLPGVLVNSPIASYTPGWVFAPFTWFAVAAVLGAALVASRRVTWTPWVASTLVSVLAAGPALAVMVFVASGSYFEIPARYGAALVPFVLVCATFVLRNRTMTIIVTTYAGIIMAVNLWLAWYLGTLAP